jgi:hypothetical protein
MAISRRIAAALGAGLALSFPVTSPAQTTPSGAGISSGSGSGTGTGGSGLGATGTGTSGAMSPSGTSRNPRSGVDAGPRTTPSQGSPFRTQPGGMTGAGGADGPGADVPESSPATGRPLPGTALGPIESLRGTESGRPIYGMELTEEQLKELDARLLQEARAITQPAERALALTRVARSKLSGQDFTTAQAALAEAGQAALEVPAGLARDLRIMGVVSNYIALAEAQSSQGRAEDNLRDVDEPLPKEFLETWSRALKAAQKSWSQAADLSIRIGRRPYRSETLYLVVESQASDLTRRGALLDESEDRGAALLKSVGAARLRDALALVDAGLLQNAAQARRIDLPQWRDRALAAVVTGAAGARRFERGLEIARSIPQPEARADALLRLAETQARHGTPEKTTQIYAETLRAIASIPVVDLRSTLTGVLIDSLISSGRFEDARTATVLYPDSPRRLAALGAVAESQGRRGLAKSAKTWIAQETSPDVQAQLYRRLNDGILASLEQYRTNVLSINPDR